MGKNISGAQQVLKSALTDSILIPISGGYRAVTIGELAKYIHEKYPQSGGTAKPTVNAGFNHSITLPTNSLTLKGSAIAESGATISSYQWTQVSGPSAANIVSPTQATTLVNGLVEGSYVFSLKAIDSKSAFAIDNVNIYVNPLVTGSITGVFDTSLTFSASTTDSRQGVLGIVASTSSYEFHFNKITNPTGANNTMQIWLNDSLIMVINFPSAYLNRKCKITRGSAPFGPYSADFSFINGDIFLVDENQTQNPSDPTE